MIFSRFLLVSSAFLLAFLALAGSPAAWRPLAVPGLWQKAGDGPFAKHDGLVWYRCFVKVPATWNGDDLALTLQGVSNSFEVFFNGAKIGGAGELPPNFRDGYGTRPTSFTVPAGNVKPGVSNLLTLRMYGAKGQGGFKGAAPFLANEAEAIALAGTWQARIGDEVAWANSGDAPVKEATFAKVEAAAVVAKRLLPEEKERGPLAPAEALKQFTVAGDLQWRTVLAEPVVKQPLSLSFDERGRMWVVQYLQYPNPAGLKLVSRDRYWRAVYDKVPPPPPNHFKGKDKITIHESTRGDGVYDKHKTFVDGLNIATAAVAGRGGVWILNPPYLLFYPDKNGDDVRDGPPDVHLEGFGLEDTHSVANSLRWGPDGWLYAAQGSTVTGHVKRPGDKTAVHSMGQLIWRYHPEKRLYEIFAEGGGNAFGVEIDSKGRLYSGHNGGNTRGFHYVQGGYYQKGFSKHGPLTNTYAFGYFSWMKHPNVPRFTHTFVVNDGGTLGQAHANKVFSIAPLQSHLIESTIRADGSTWQTMDVGHPVTSADAWFRPVDIKLGPDGALYVADFYDAHIAHLRHFDGQIDTETGRVYRLSAKDAKAQKPRDLGKLSSRELIELLRDDNCWTRQTALRLLGDRRDAAVIPVLRDLVQKSDGQFALEALWALNLSGGLDAAFSLQALAHADPFVRLWTVRLLGDDNKVAKSQAKVLAEMAKTEANAEVRSQLACSARRLGASQGLPVVRALLARDEDANDPHLPLLLWWALEAKATENRAAVLRLFDDSAVWRLPLVEKHILERLMRRYALEGGRANYLTCAALLDKAPTAGHAKLLLNGVEQAFAGRSLAGLPDELIKAIARRGGGSLALRLRLDEPAALDQALQLIEAPKTDAKQRLALVRILGEAPRPRAVPLLVRLAREDKDIALRQAALVALLPYGDPAIGRDVLAMLPKLPGEVRDVALSLLVSRKAWTHQLLDAVEADKLARKDVPVELIRKLSLLRDETIARRAEKLFGKIQGATTEQMRRRIGELETVLREGSGSPYPGKKLFEANCAKCHTLFGKGGSIGPDLTSYQRDDFAVLLVNIVNPSAEIREGFENHLLVTKDGRTLLGFLLEQTNQVVVLRGAEGQDVAVPRNQIDELRAVGQSLMPEGLLDGLVAQQVRDLFAYLRSSQPLND